MSPDTVPTPPLPDPAAGEPVAPPKRRTLVGSIGLAFSCVAVLALLMMLLLQPG